MCCQVFKSTVPAAVSKEVKLVPFVLKLNLKFVPLNKPK